MSALSRASFCDVPEDVALIIFDLVADDDHDGFDMSCPKTRYTLMAICRRWRQLIMSSPVLWKVLSIFLGDDTTSRHTYPMLSQALRLSGDAPLSIHLGIGPMYTVACTFDMALPSTKQATMETLYSSASRWKALNLYITNRSLYSLIPPLHHDMPSLEYVYILLMICPWDTRLITASPVLAFSSAPRLKAVNYCSDVAMLSSSPEFPWAGVRVLKVIWPRSDGDVTERTRELLDTVRAGALKTLSLSLFDVQMTGSFPCVTSTFIEHLKVSSHNFKVLSFLRMPLLRELDVTVARVANPAGENDALMFAAAFVASSPRISVLSGSSFVFSQSVKTLVEGTPCVTSLSWTFYADPSDVGFLTFLSTSTCLPLLEQVTVVWGCGVDFFAEEETPDNTSEEDFEGETRFNRKFADAVLRLDAAPHRMGVLKRVNISFGTFDGTPLQQGGLEDIRNDIRDRSGTGGGIQLLITTF